MSRYTLKNGIALISAVNPPVNSLSTSVRNGLALGLKQARSDNAKAIIIVGNGKTFPAGADINEFKTKEWRNQPDLNELVEELDASNIPVVAAIHGTALGGGLELALACNYRVALKSAVMGLPEVHLGLLPGAGGTQRLPRVVGAEKSLDIIGLGRPISAVEAEKIGLVDQLVSGKDDEDILKGAIRFVESLDSTKKKLPRISDRTAETVDENVYKNAEKAFSKKMRGQIAPSAIVNAIKASTVATSFEAGLKKEESLFEGLMNGEQAPALTHMFFAERECSKVDGIDPKLGHDLRHVAIIGAGTMGRGITMCFINQGIPVTLVEADAVALQEGIQGIESTYKKSSAYKSGKMTDKDVSKKLGLVTGTVDIKDVGDCDAVIEAVFENLELKKGIFSQLGKICKPDALLCSNTSYLDVDLIAEASERPEMVIGTHFFSPANVMPLLENIRGVKSSPTAIATAMKMGQRLRKTTVLAGNCFGFIGNRMFEPYSQQAITLLEEGATPSQVDSALGPTGFGFAMGPLSVLDLAGNDIGYRIRQEDYYPYTSDQVKGKYGETWMELANEICNKGRLGQKTGKGWYKYDGRTALDDDEVEKICDKHRDKHGIKKKKGITAQEIVERCVYPLINEGYRILEGGFASRPSDIDVVWNAGYGFPRYKGGPMFYGDRVGPGKVANALQLYHMTNPELQDWQFTPCPLLLEVAESQLTLEQFRTSK